MFGLLLSDFLAWFADFELLVEEVLVDFGPLDCELLPPNIDCNVPVLLFDGFIIGFAELILLSVDFEVCCLDASRWTGKPWSLGFLEMLSVGYLIVGLV